MDTPKYFISAIKKTLIIFCVCGMLPVFSDTGKTFGVFVNDEGNKILLHTSADKKGRVFHTTRQIPFRVIDTEFTDETLMLKIEFPFRTVNTNRSGYVVFPDNLSAKANKDATADNAIKVFDEIPIQKDNYPSYTIVNPKQIQYSGVVGESALYADIKWYEVNYKIETPLTFWVDASKGIYREFGDLKTANNLLRLIDRYSPDVADNLLLGNIQRGYAQRDVLLALGEPFDKVKGENNTESWHYPLLSLEFSKNNRVSKVRYY